jgi:hypothetical protein
MIGVPVIGARRRAAGVTTGSRWASAGLLRRPEKKVWDMFAAWDGIQMDSVQDILYRIIRNN